MRRRSSSVEGLHKLRGANVLVGERYRILSSWRDERRCPMPERNLPAWAIGIGAELRDRTDKLPINEPYLVDATELLREMTERELAERRLRCGRGDGE